MQAHEEPSQSEKGKMAQSSEKYKPRHLSSFARVKATNRTHLIRMNQDAEFNSLSIMVYLNGY